MTEEKFFAHKKADICIFKTIMDGHRVLFGIIKKCVV